MGGRPVGHARPDRAARAVFRDSEPRGAGGDINDRLSVERDEIPFPPWDSSDVAEQVDLLTGHWPRVDVARKVPRCAQTCHARSGTRCARSACRPATGREPDMRVFLATASRSSTVRSGFKRTFTDPVEVTMSDSAAASDGSGTSMTPRTSVSPKVY